MKTRKTFLINKEEKKQLELEGFEIKLNEELEVNDLCIYRVIVPQVSEDDVEVALEFIRSKTKGYGSCHIMELCIIPEKRIEQKTVGFKELIRLHHYNGLKDEIPFTAEKEGQFYCITYPHDVSDIVSILTR